MAEIIDRISKLPVHIIHDILGRACKNGLKEEAQICVLSKTWNSIWRGRPDVIIFQSNFHNKSLENFVQFVDDSLQPHVEQNLRIETLRLMNLYSPELVSHMDRWIELATKHNVRFLEIGISWSGSLYYTIPDAIYSAKALTKLSLYKCNFEINHNSTTNKLQKLIATCPLIRDLKLSRCRGLQNNLYVSGLVNLENLELRACEKLDKVEIRAPKLCKFLHVGSPLHKHRKTHEPESLPCTIDILDGYNTLKYLHLEDSTMTDQEFEYQLSKLTALEVLILKGSYVMKNINVVSEKLKRFSLWDWGNVEKVNMMLAPNLKMFDFEGIKMPFSISTMDPCKLERANLRFYLMPEFRNSYIFGDVETSWCNNIQDFVQKFNYSKGLIFVIICEKNNSILIYEDPREIVVPPTRELKLHIEIPSMCLESFAYNLIRNFHPKIVSIVPCTESKILQVFRETTKESRMKQYKQSKRLNEVSIHKGAVDNHEDNGRKSYMYSWLKSTSLIERITTFTFKWEKKVVTQN
ncbi:uncharacterized protein LOC125857685 [Solanum stenotomum]|uniref:uncharacterized protein LOC125857685 n=1 Tax=Solanum stenotomum TaxID=172797 RepID=UPI0020D182B4|nr:uncharacterized protein LOC125857685 [Solanum stenotomum]